MTEFETKRLPVDKDAAAPDGSDVRVLLRLHGGRHGALRAQARRNLAGDRP